MEDLRVGMEELRVRLEAVVVERPHVAKEVVSGELGVEAADVEADNRACFLRRFRPVCGIVWGHLDD
jgi:hypothetical protein